MFQELDRHQNWNRISTVDDDRVDIDYSYQNN